MTILQSILLGIVQGLTEFLPISSSAHLVIVPYLLGWNIPADQAFVFDVLVQLATLAALIIFFWKDLWAIAKAWVTGLFHRTPFADTQSRLGWYLILATIPAVVIGYPLKNAVEKAFISPLLTGLFMFVTAALLVVAELVGKRQRNLESLTWIDALWVGLFQAISIFPGISRSGSTISGGMMRNLERPAAARFAFLMSVPVMVGAGLLAFLDLLKIPGLGHVLLVFIPGFIAAGVVGYLAIRWLLGYLVKHTLYDFAIYCIALGTIVVVMSLIR
jgi:undecaprenyl-diphosphatase